MAFLRGQWLPCLPSQRQKTAVEEQNGGLKDGSYSLCAGQRWNVEGRAGVRDSCFWLIRHFIQVFQPWAFSSSQASKPSFHIHGKCESEEATPDHQQLSHSGAHLGREFKVKSGLDGHTSYRPHSRRVLGLARYSTTSSPDCFCVGCIWHWHILSIPVGSVCTGEIFRSSFNQRILLWSISLAEDVELLISCGLELTEVAL